MFFRSFSGTVLCAALIVAGATSCRMFDPSTARKPAMDGLPDGFQKTGADEAAVDRWWEAFDKPELAAFIDLALRNSLDLEQAHARVLQARALARQAGAGRAPSVTGEAGAATSRVRRPGMDGFDRESFNEFSLGLAAGYEIDLWGRVRAGLRSSQLGEEAAGFDLQAAAIGVAAEVSTRWLQIALAETETTIVEAQLETNLRFLELLELRQRQALATALDVMQQRQIVAATRTLLPSLRREKESATHQLNILAGRPPRAPLAFADPTLPDLPPLPDVGLPADLLARRPDLQAAWRRLEAGEWNLTAAKADRLPALRLTGSATYGGGDLDLLFDGWARRLAASLTAPLLDGGRRAAEVQRLQATLDQRLAEYRKAVLVAIREVEDALSREHHNRERLTHLDVQLEHARDTLAEADRRYRRGLNDYLPVLTTLEAVQRLERTTLLARYDLLINRVGLYRALGGAWASETAAQFDTAADQKGATQQTSNQQPATSNQQPATSNQQPATSNQ